MSDSVDEDQALDAIRKLTYDDDPSFPVLMQQIIDMATDYRDQYNIIAMKRKPKNILSTLLDRGIRYASNGQDIYRIRVDGLYGTNRVIHRDNLVPGSPGCLMDIRTGRKYLLLQ